MNYSDTKNSSRTNWEHLDELADEEIDTSDSPPLTDEFFAKAQWLRPGERSPRQAAKEAVKVEIELDPQILAWFQAQGQDYQNRMRAASRLYAEAHRAA